MLGILEFLVNLSRNSRLGNLDKEFLFGNFRIPRLFVGIFRNSKI